MAIVDFLSGRISDMSPKPIAPGARLGEVVAWRVDDLQGTAAAYKAKATGAAIVAGLFSSWLNLGGTASFPNAIGGTAQPGLRLPTDPDEPLDLDLLAIGRSPWTPPPVAAEEPRELMFASQRAVWTAPSAFDNPPRRPFPASELQILGIARMGDGNERKAMSAWKLRVGNEHDSITITGRWLALAYLGTLAGWPNPSSDLAW